jgi:hypothetical protein
MTLNPLRINYLFVTYSGKLCSVLEDLKDLMILKQSYTDFLPLTINHGIRE